MLGWSGLAAVLMVGIVVNVRDAFPGWIALLPLLAAGTILVADENHPAGVGRLLGRPWLAGLGDASYALYLVHWPILVGYVVLIDRDEPSLAEGAAIIAGSLVLAVLLHRFVERPLRGFGARWGPWRNLLVVLVGIGLVVLAVAGWRQVPRPAPVPAPSAAADQHPGARVLAKGYVDSGRPSEPSVPTMAELPHQWALEGPACPAGWKLPTRAQQRCMVLTDPAFGSGDADAVAADLPLQADPGTERVLLVGNSHVQQWSTAIREIGRAKGWQVLLIYEQSCYLAPSGDPINADEKKCVDFWPDALDAIEPLAPDLVLTLGTRSEVDGETVLEAGLAALAEHARPGRTIIAMRDTPRLAAGGLVQCQAERGDGDPPCSSGHPVLESPNPLTPLVRPIAGLTTLDLGPVVCPDRRCVPEIGNVKVWMDNHHLTRAYVSTTNELVLARVLSAIERA